MKTISYTIKWNNANTGRLLYFGEISIPFSAFYLGETLFEILSQLGVNESLETLISREESLLYDAPPNLKIPVLSVKDPYLLKPGTILQREDLADSIVRVLNVGKVWLDIEHWPAWFKGQPMIRNITVIDLRDATTAELEDKRRRLTLSLPH